MGILLEADYKGVITGQEPVWSGLQKAFSKTKKGSANPLERKDGEDFEPLEEGGQITYELMNRDSGECLMHDGRAMHSQARVSVAADIAPLKSCSARQRIQRRHRPFVSVHLRRQWRTRPTTTLHHHQARG